MLRAHGEPQSRGCHGGRRGEYRSGLFPVHLEIKLAAPAAPVDRDDLDDGRSRAQRHIKLEQAGRVDALALTVDGEQADRIAGADATEDGALCQRSVYLHQSDAARRH